MINFLCHALTALKATTTHNIPPRSHLSRSEILSRAKIRIYLNLKSPTAVRRNPLPLSHLFDHGANILTGCSPSDTSKRYQKNLQVTRCPLIFLSTPSAHVQNSGTVDVCARVLSSRSYHRQYLFCARIMIYAQRDLSIVCTRFVLLLTLLRT
jgi:hypothetical protein